jgi:hypothetical protein
MQLKKFILVPGVWFEIIIKGMFDFICSFRVALFMMNQQRESINHGSIAIQ